MSDVQIEIGIIMELRLVREALEYQFHTDIPQKFHVCYEADNIVDLSCKFSSNFVANLPDVLLIDSSLIIENADFWTRKNIPQLKIISFSSDVISKTLLRQMVNLGVDAYLTYNTNFLDLKDTIIKVHKYGSFFPIDIAYKIFEEEEEVYNFKESAGSALNYIKTLSDIDKQIFQLICTTEFTYKEIANQLNVSERTVEYVRMNLFDAFEVKTRMGLSLLAHKCKVFNINQFQGASHVKA